jgi:hypothetical protein
MTRRLSPLLLAVLLSLAVPGVAAAEDAPYVGWSEFLPGVPAMPYEPSSEDDCLAGRTQCVDKVIREMERRFDTLAASCDHDSIFALAYLRTTEEYRRTIEDPDFFDDTRFVNHEDVVFAAAYFAAYDAYHSSARAATPGAWAVAFEAAERRELPAAGNLALGINAHVQRDLPHVLAAIGMVTPHASSRKPDHDRVNRFLNRVTDGLIAEIAQRFDPTIDDGDLPTLIDDVGKFQSIPAWREIAWRNAERLVSAPTPEMRALVAADIEAYSTSQAELLRSSMAYGPVRDSDERDAYCAAHG